MQILAVAGTDVDPAFERLLERLGEQGHDVRRVRSAGEAELAVRNGRTDVLVAADGAPELLGRAGGLPVAAWLGGRESDRTADLLEAGFDEVLCAAMSLREQAARIEAAARRMPAPPESVTFGPLRVDRARGEATWHGRRLQLTPRERDVLQALAEARGATVRRETLYRTVWGYAMARGDRTVDVNVKRLRDKLAAAVGPPLRIETEPSVGYRLEVSEHAVTAL